MLKELEDKQRADRVKIVEIDACSLPVEPVLLSESAQSCVWRVAGLEFDFLVLSRDDGESSEREHLQAVCPPARQAQPVVDAGLEDKLRSVFLPDRVPVLTLRLALRKPLDLSALQINNEEETVLRFKNHDVLLWAWRERAAGTSRSEPREQVNTTCEKRSEVAEVWHVRSTMQVAREAGEDIAKMSREDIEEFLAQRAVEILLPAFSELWQPWSPPMEATGGASWTYDTLRHDAPATSPDAAALPRCLFAPTRSEAAAVAGELFKPDRTATEHALQTNAGKTVGVCGSAFLEASNPDKFSSELSGDVTRVCGNSSGFHYAEAAVLSGRALASEIMEWCLREYGFEG